MSAGRPAVFLLLLATFLLSACGTARKAVDREAHRRHEVVEYARRFVGAPYRYGGTNPRQGFDCSGFTAYVMQHVDLRLPHQSRAQAKSGTPVKPKQVQPGDLIFYRRGGGPIFHVSLVVSNDRRGITVVHSVNDGVKLENISQSSYWRPKIASARDVMGRKRP